MSRVSASSAPTRTTRDIALRAASLSPSAARRRSFAILLRVHLGLDFAHDTAERWHGVVLPEDDARAQILLGGGIALRFARGWDLEVDAQARALSVSHKVSYDYPGLVGLRISTELDIAHAGGIIRR